MNGPTSLTPDHPMTCTICCAPGLLRLLHPRVGEPTRRDGHHFFPVPCPAGPRGPLGTGHSCRTDSTGICKHFPSVSPSPCELISKADTAGGVDRKSSTRCLGPGRQRTVGAEKGPDICSRLWEQDGGSHGGLVRASAQGTLAGPLWG